MYELKTKQNDKDVYQFLDSVSNEKRRKDSYIVLELMKKVTNEEPKMWGDGIIGFGSYHYKYKSGHEADWCITGFSPRKQSLTLYIMPGFDKYEELLQKLGKHKTGKSCLYINKLEDIDLDVLEELVQKSVDAMRVIYNLTGTY